VRGNADPNPWHLRRVMAQVRDQIADVHVNVRRALEGCRS
jgi:hypothetical protein